MANFIFGVYYRFYNHLSLQFLSCNLVKTDIRVMHLIWNSAAASVYSMVRNAYAYPLWTSCWLWSGGWHFHATPPNENISCSKWESSAQTVGNCISGNIKIKIFQGEHATVPPWSDRGSLSSEVLLPPEQPSKCFLRQCTLATVLQICLLETQRWVQSDPLPHPWVIS